VLIAFDLSLCCNVAVRQLMFSRRKSVGEGNFQQGGAPFEADMQKVLCIMSATFGKLPQDKSRILAKK
jgi:hypothetical protein